MRVATDALMPAIVSFWVRVSSQLVASSRKRMRVAIFGFSRLVLASRRKNLQVCRGGLLTSPDQDRQTGQSIGPQGHARLAVRSLQPSLSPVLRSQAHCDVRAQGTSRVHLPCLAFM